MSLPMLEQPHEVIDALNSARSNESTIKGTHQMTTHVREGIIAECNAIANLLLTKNAAYGNSIFDPVGIFSKGNWLDAVHVRIDDKLSRLARGTASGEDVELDLIGYLILKRVGLKMQAKAAQ